MDGLLQRQFFYSMTGKTGGGKTAIALFIAAMVALGKTVDGREYTKGRVLYLPAKTRSIFTSDGSPWPSNTILRPIKLRFTSSRACPPFRKWPKRSKSKSKTLGAVCWWSRHHRSLF